jgi:hypothetical protein
LKKWLYRKVIPYLPLNLSDGQCTISCTTGQVFFKNSFEIDLTDWLRRLSTIMNPKRTAVQT